MKLFDGHTSENKHQALVIAQAIYGGAIDPKSKTLDFGLAGHAYVGAFTGGDPMFSNPNDHDEGEHYIPRSILSVDKAILFRTYTDNRSITIYSVPGHSLRQAWKERQFPSSRSLRWDTIHRIASARQRFATPDTLMARAGINTEDLAGAV